MADSNAVRLREMLSDADESDPVFSDERIAQLLSDNSNNLERAAFEGWRLKMAHYSELIDITEGNASRKMSDLMKNAQMMMKVYEDSRGGPTEGRTRIGRIIRST